VSSPTSGPPEGQPAPGNVGPWSSDNLPSHPMANAEPQPVEQPRTIRTAVRLMWVGAAFSLLGVPLTFTQTDAIRDSIEDSDRSLTQSQIDTAVNVGVAVAVISGLIGVGLWLWMASANGKGKSWARVVATVLGALNVFATLLNLAGNAVTPLSVILGIVSVGLAAAILVLLYRPDATRYYEVRSR
jgi:hypothetical protein